MADISFSHVRKVFEGGVVAVEDFTLTIPSPKLVVLVGPSGCGKTTVLRLIAGLERPTSGTITLGNDRLDTVEPRRRDVAMVFQSYALYPHMTVAENLSFGLRIRKVRKEDIARRVQVVAETLEIDGLLDRRPGQLSGGQRQRVALGRAIIREPKAFLFDEPLSNLDARLRDEMRYTIKRLYQRLQTTTVYVTHDQVEAMTIGEMLVIMKAGRIHQVGTPQQCYRRPGDTFVASFLGSPPMNLIEGTLAAGERSVALGDGGRVALPAGLAEALERRGEKRVILGVRPEDVRAAGGDAGGELRLRGRVVLEETLGHEVLTHVDVGGQELIVRGKEGFAVGEAGREAGREGGQASLTVGVERVHVFSADNGERIDVPPQRG